MIPSMDITLPRADFNETKGLCAIPIPAETSK